MLKSGTGCLYLVLLLNECIVIRRYLYVTQNVENASHPVSAL